MNNILTDRKILQKIYDQYYKVFVNYNKDDNTRDSKIYVPIDVVAIANSFKVDPDIIFGRLYYHLNKKYGYIESDGKTRVDLFSPVIGKDRNGIQFPLLSAILSDMQDTNLKHNLSIFLSVLAILISLFTIIFNLIY